MTKNWRDLEILIGVFLILIGGSFSYFIIETLIYVLDTFNNHPQSFPDGASVISILWPYNISLGLSIMTVSGGILMILRRKLGWIISLLATSILSLLFVILIIRSAINDGQFMWIFLLFTGVLLLIFFTLLARPFRRKYVLSKRSKLYIFGVAIVLVIDACLILI